MSIVWRRDFAYIILEAGSVCTFSFLLAQQQEPAMLNRLSWMNLALSCLVPELVDRGSLWNTGRHIWTGQYLIFKEDAFLTKPCYFFWIWVHSWTCIFGCFAVHTFKSTLMNRSITLHETCTLPQNYAWNFHLSIPQNLCNFTFRPTHLSVGASLGTRGRGNMHDLSLLTSDFCKT